MFITCEKKFFKKYNRVQLILICLLRSIYFIFFRLRLKDNIIWSFLGTTRKTGFFSAVYRTKIGSETCEQQVAKIDKLVFGFYAYCIYLYIVLYIYTYTIYYILFILILYTCNLKY